MHLFSNIKCPVHVSGSSLTFIIIFFLVSLVQIPGQVISLDRMDVSAALKVQLCKYYNLLYLIIFGIKFQPSTKRSNCLVPTKCDQASGGGARWHDRPLIMHRTQRIPPVPAMFELLNTQCVHSPASCTYTVSLNVRTINIPRQVSQERGKACLQAYR